MVNVLGRLGSKQYYRHDFEFLQYNTSGDGYNGRELFVNLNYKF